MVLAPLMQRLAAAEGEISGCTAAGCGMPGGDSRCSGSRVAVPAAAAVVAAVVAAASAAGVVVALVAGSEWQRYCCHHGSHLGVVVRDP